MYVGRFVVVGPGAGAYRVSSRSFPHRRIEERDGALAVVPTADAPETDNPYVSYNCVRTAETPAGAAAVLGNGSHVDPIAEKLALGYPPRDALAHGLLTLDYEKDDYDTPRLAGVVGGRADGDDNAHGDDNGHGDGAYGHGDGNGHGDGDGHGAYVGIVRRDALLVEAVGEPTLVATYERDEPEAFAFDAAAAPEAARAAYDLDFEHPVCAAGVARTDAGFEFAVENGPDG